MAQVIGERVLAEGKLWWQAGARDVYRGIHGATWRPGRLYLTVERLLWWSEFDQRVLVDIPLARVRSLRLENVPLGGDSGGDAGGVFGLREVLAVTLAEPPGVGSQRGETVLFAGDALPQWRRQIKEQVLDYRPGGYENGGSENGRDEGFDA
jgi:hypothetical protein